MNGMNICEPLMQYVAVYDQQGIQIIPAYMFSEPVPGRMFSKLLAERPYWQKIQTITGTD